jgi:hypothetical protein
LQAGVRARPHEAQRCRGAPPVDPRQVRGNGRQELSVGCESSRTNRPCRASPGRGRRALRLQLSQLGFQARHAAGLHQHSLQIAREIRPGGAQLLLTAQVSERLLQERQFEIGLALHVDQA